MKIYERYFVSLTKIIKTLILAFNFFRYIYGGIHYQFLLQVATLEQMMEFSFQTTLNSFLECSDIPCEYFRENKLQ